MLLDLLINEYEEKEQKFKLMSAKSVRSRIIEDGVWVLRGIEINNENDAFSFL